MNTVTNIDNATSTSGQTNKTASLPKIMMRGYYVGPLLGYGEGRNPQMKSAQIA